MVSLISTKATVTNVAAIRKIIATFDCQGFVFTIRTQNGKSTLRLESEGSGSRWPLASKSDQVPSKDDFLDMVSYLETRDNFWYDEGPGGFRALLLELAPYLKTSLVILAAEMESGFAAQTWSVQPKGKEVQELVVPYDK